MQKWIFNAKIRNVGNSFVITLPKFLFKKLKLKKGDYIEVIVRK